MLVLALLPFQGCSRNAQDAPRPVIKEGVLDLRPVPLDSLGPVNLDGEWQFFWHQALIQDQGSIELDTLKAGFLSVPGAWNSYRQDGERVGQRGYASYRLRILLPELAGVPALRFQTVGTAYRLYINGESIGGAGEFGTDRESSQPEYRPAIYPVSRHDGVFDIVVEVSNFHHRSGGLWESIQFGMAKDLQREREQRVALSLFLVGAILVMGIYHLVLYLLRTSDPSILYFGIFCLVIALRNLTTGEVYLPNLVPFLGWELLLKLEYLTFFTGIPLFFLVLQKLFPREITERVMLVVAVVGGLFSLLALVTPAMVFTRSLIYFQLLSFLAAIFALYRVGIALVRGMEGAGLVLSGFAILVIAFLNDVLYANNLIGTGYLISYGVLVFILIQAFLMSQRFATAYRTIEQQRGELSSTNQAYLNEINVRKAAEEEVRRHQDHLEELVQERTSELETANARLREMSLVDGLTQIANRRRLDEDLEREWRRMLRDKTSLAVILADIDYFKFFNDTYGHQEGDACLVQVAKAIQSCVHRPGDLAARYGGEEFCLLLPETDLEGAVYLAEQVRNAVQELRVIHERSEVSEHVTMSLGVAAGIPTNDLELSDLVAHADQALYAAKKSGRNRVFAKNFPEED